MQNIVEYFKINAWFKNTAVLNKMIGREFLKAFECFNEIGIVLKHSSFKKLKLNENEKINAYF